MNNLMVGQKYPGNYRQEGIKLEYNKGFTLYIFLPQIAYDEALGFKKGKYKFALTEVDGILFFLSEFKGAIDMSDSQFHFALYSDKDNRIKDLPDEIEESQGVALNVVVVDSHSGIIKALRLIGLSHCFSTKLIDICKKQSIQQINKYEYNIKLLNIQNQYSADDLYKLSEIECEGK